MPGNKRSSMLLFVMDDLSTFRFPRSEQFSSAWAFVSIGCSSQRELYYKFSFLYLSFNKVIIFDETAFAQVSKQKVNKNSKAKILD